MKKSKFHDAGGPDTVVSPNVGVPGGLVVKHGDQPVPHVRSGGLQPNE